jgi:hypothetical protein
MRELAALAVLLRFGLLGLHGCLRCVGGASLREDIDYLNH